MTTWKLSSDCMSGSARETFERFLRMSPNAHTIDIHMRADSKEYTFQADFLKYIEELTT